LKSKYREWQRRCNRGRAHFDNSPNNPDNADPTKEVAWGDQSWDEMMVGFFNLVFPADLPVKDIFPAPATTARQ
jgi:hypothetical protein